MSVIVREQEGRILLLCKGADSIIENRMVASRYHEQTFGALQKFASLGLRTLMLAEKYIAEEVYKEWNGRYDKALTSLAENRHEKIE